LIAKPLNKTIEVMRYDASLEPEWNRFVADSCNANFLFHRNYLDYHRDRFQDASAVVFVDGEIKAIFPANSVGKSIHTHQGLTYGGVLYRDSSFLKIQEWFRAIFEHYRTQGFEAIQYKAIPSIFSPEDRGEERILLGEIPHTLRTYVGTYADRLEFRKPSELRRRSLKLASTHHLSIQASQNWKGFWESVLEPSLWSRFGNRPIHSVAEITLLAGRFPNQIKLFEVCHEGKVVGGTVLYLFPRCAHTQYICATERGKEVGALDFLFDHLIQSRLSEQRFFSLGTSYDPQTGLLKEGLLRWKEGFGFRAIPYDVYTFPLGAIR